MRRSLIRLTFILIGGVIAISGNLLNYANGPQDVKVFDEIRCRKIVIDDGWRESNIVLEVDDGTPYITIRDKFGGLFHVHALDHVNMLLAYEDPDTGTKTSEIRLTAGKHNASITHSVHQNEDRASE